jgi:hypothetical protein
MRARGLRVDRRDLVLAAASFAAAVMYLSVCPPILMTGDEANYLHEAKRLAQGEVLYRDIFELTTPAWMLLVAGLFRLFGTDIATAKAAMWIMNGLTAGLLFLSCRALGVRRLLSWIIGLVPLALSFPAWPFASQHWLATMLTVLLLLVSLVTGERPARWRLLPGIVLGLLIATHQRGAVIGAGVGAWMVVDRLLLARDGSLLVSLAWFATGALLVLVPLTVYLVANGGVGPVWQALVVHPLLHYRAGVLCPWGCTGAIAGLFSFPTVLRYSPLVLAVPILRLAGRPKRVFRTMAPAGDPTDSRSALLLCLLMSAAAVLSIQYYPDTAHIGFIAPLLLVVAAETLEWALRRRGLLPVIGYAAIAVLAVGTVTHLYRNVQAWRRMFALREDTAFGRIAVSSQQIVEQDAYVRMLLRDAPERSLFGYPASASRLCLIADARNPTRFEHFAVGYNTPDQVEEVKAVLAKRPPAYVVVNGTLGRWDPIRPVLDRNYTALPGGRGAEPLVIFKPRATAPLPGGG